ncbi:hypothetical protein, partial [Aeromonas caviae]|uniref:hypothetical protein n=1 Tax=Aeromonas caviae TaxID=648 RepID=UPI001CC7B080
RAEVSMIVTMLGVTWKIRSWKTGKVPFRPLFVYKSQGYGRHYFRNPTVSEDGRRCRRSVSNCWWRELTLVIPVNID